MIDGSSLRDGFAHTSYFSSGKLKAQERKLGRIGWIIGFWRDQLVCAKPDRTPNGD